MIAPPHHHCPLACWHQLTDSRVGGREHQACWQVRGCGRLQWETGEGPTKAATVVMQAKTTHSVLLLVVVLNIVPAREYIRLPM